MSTDKRQKRAIYIRDGFWKGVSLHCPDREQIERLKLACHLRGASIHSVLNAILEAITKP